MEHRQASREPDPVAVVRAWWNAAGPALAHVAALRGYEDGLLKFSRLPGPSPTVTSHDAGQRLWGDSSPSPSATGPTDDVPFVEPAGRIRCGSFSPRILLHHPVHLGLPADALSKIPQGETLP